MHKLVIATVLLLAAGQSPSAQENGSTVIFSSPQNQVSDRSKAVGAGAEAATNATAPAPIDQAWSVLQAGLGSKAVAERAAAVRALGLLERDQRAQELALKALEDKSPEVRTAAATSLGQMDAKSAAPRLGQQILGSEKNVDVVLACAHSMLELGDNRGFGVYYAVLTGERKKSGGFSNTQKQMLKQVWQDPKKMAIGFLPFGGVAYDTFQGLHQDNESPARAAAAKVLAKDPDPKTEAALLKAISDKSWAVRVAALEALAHRDNRKVIPQIEPKLKDKKHVVGYTAASTIIRLNNVEVGRSQKDDSILFQVSEKLVDD